MMKSRPGVYSLSVIMLLSLALTVCVYVLSAAAAVNDAPAVNGRAASSRGGAASGAGDNGAVFFTRVKITAGDTTLYANLYDNRPAREFAALLPLTLDAFDRIGLVKSTRLPRRISDDGKRTREYAVGVIFYWPEGPEVAFCYSDHLPQTVVDVIHIGRLEAGADFFEHYAGNIYIERVGEVPTRNAPGKQN